MRLRGATQVVHHVMVRGAARCPPPRPGTPQCKMPARVSALPELRSAANEQLGGCDGDREERKTRGAVEKALLSQQRARKQKVRDEARELYGGLPAAPQQFQLVLPERLLTSVAREG